jgi:hypothetical protein
MKDQIKELEEKYWEGMTGHDFDVVKSLTQFPCFIAGKNGVMSVDEESFKKMFDSHKDIDTKVNNISAVQTRMLTADTAVIIYEIDVSYAGQSMQCACTSTWQNENGQWKCAVHSESTLEKKE